MADPSGTDDSSGSRTPTQDTAEGQFQLKQNNQQGQQPSARAANDTDYMSLQRVLSSPQQGNASIDGVIEGTRDRLTKSGTSSPAWPTSPRLKSPPPTTNRGGSRRDISEQAQSNTAKRLAPVSAPDLAAAMLLPGGSREHSQAQSSSSSLRVPPRGISAQNTGLETVAEGSVPTTPSIDLKVDPMSQSEISNAETKINTSNANPNTTLNETSRPAGIKADSEPKSRALSSTKPPSNLAKRSFTSLTGGKKTAIEPVRTMTVETETVNTTTPGLGDRNRDGGSVRTKTSTETIRPKKEKKKPTKKPGNLPAGGLASKADIFEAKVASAVDEADTDDSDETFVYESNPPDPRAYRHHSRTPSATSVASTNDYRTNKHSIRNGSSAIPGKKSMKFSNSMHNREYEDDPNRAGLRNASATPRHHHIGRYSRNNHPGLFDNDSPFTQARHPQSPRNATGNLKSPRPNSPRVGNGRVNSPRKYGANAYDNNEDVADDERAPLMGTVRVRGNRHSRRPLSRDFRSMELGEYEEPSYWTRCGGWLLLVTLFLFICSGIGTFVMAVNRPLLDVEIRKIINVLASEEELMLDLDVEAVNPNLFAVTVTDLDVNIFAQSPYVGTHMDWHRQHPGSGLRLSIAERRVRQTGWFWPDPTHADDGVDEGTDPDDPEGAQKMLLGRVTELDSPLTFEPAPIRRTSSSSVGEIRLQKPGNKTEVGGSERWERVLLHDFDLIVRGVIKYQLPLSSKVRSVKVGGRKIVHPDSEDKETGDLSPQW